MKTYKEFLKFLKENAQAQNESTFEELSEKMDAAGLFETWTDLRKKLDRDEEAEIRIIEHFANSTMSDGRTVIQFVKDNYHPETPSKPYGEDVREMCGPMDYIIWKYVDPTYELGGYHLKTIAKEDILIKLSYGYHKSKWGIKCFETAFGSVENMFKHMCGPFDSRNDWYSVHQHGDIVGSYENGVYKLTCSDPRDCEEIKDGILGNSGDKVSDTEIVLQ